MARIDETDLFDHFLRTNHFPTADLTGSTGRLAEQTRYEASASQSDTQRSHAIFQAFYTQSLPTPLPHLDNASSKPSTASESLRSRSLHSSTPAHEPLRSKSSGKVPKSNVRSQKKSLRGREATKPAEQNSRTPELGQEVPNFEREKSRAVNGLGVERQSGSLERPAPGWLS